MLHGELGFEKDVIGDLVSRDDKVISSEFLSPYISAKIPELVSATMEFFLVSYLAGSFCRNSMMPMLPKPSLLWGYK